MDWRRGYSAMYYMTLVDPKTLRDTTRFELTGGTIKLESTGLLTSADLDCVNYRETSEKIIRVWLDAYQLGEDGGHTPLFTGYTSSPDRNINGSKETQTLQCYSVLLPASDVLLPRGWYAPIDIDGLNIIRTLLGVTKFPIEISNTLDKNRNLSSAIIAEDGETHLSMVEKILNVINWRMWIKGDGTICLAPYDKNPVNTFDAVINDVVETNLTVSYDWFNCPNVVRVVMDDEYAIARDIDSDTPMSMKNRGREVWYEETNCILNDGETLQEYANRALSELQRVSKTINYDRRFIPDIYPLDIIRMNFPKQDIIGNFMITSQNINLGYNAKTTEEVIAI